MASPFIRTFSASRTSSTPQPNGNPQALLFQPPVNGAVLPVNGEEEPKKKVSWPEIPQALSSNYSQRIKADMQTALVVPVVQTSTATSSIMPPRSARRGASNINYAEDDDDDFEDRGDRRGGGGGAAAAQQPSRVEATSPVVVPGRLAHRRLAPMRTAVQYKEAAQSFDNVYVPIRLDINIDASRKIRDAFLWNIYEPMTTFEGFALEFCRDTDCYDNKRVIDEIVLSMRSQVQDWAAIALIDWPDYILNPEDGKNPTRPVLLKLELELGNHSFNDKVEWDLLNTEIVPEDLARVTSRDLGLSPEEETLLTVGLYEAILKAKKEMFEAGNMVQVAVETEAHSIYKGLRYNADNLGGDWGANLEFRSKEDREKQEMDRERQNRRLRRETARFQPINLGSSSYGWPTGDGGISEPQTPGGAGASQPEAWRRRKRPNNMREDSPVRRGSYTRGGGPAGLGGQLEDAELRAWKCRHCQITGPNTIGIRDGPDGRRSLCEYCGKLYSENGELPLWRYNFYKNGPW